MTLNLSGYRAVVPVGDATLLDIGWSFYALFVTTLFRRGLRGLAQVERIDGNRS